MKAQYEKCSRFVAVLTPHFIEQKEKRENLLPLDWNLESYFEKLWEVAEENITFAVQFGNAYVYGRKVYNFTRRRWELEFISLTPSKRLHTDSKKYARLIILE